MAIVSSVGLGSLIVACCEYCGCEAENVLVWIDNCNGHRNYQRVLDFFIGGRSFQLSEAISECLLESIAGMLFCNPLFKLPCEQRNKGEQFWNRRKDI